MLRILLSVFFFVAIITTVQAGKPVPAFHLPSGITNEDFFPGKIIFKIKPSYRNYCTRNAISVSSLEKKFLALRVASVEKKFPKHQPPGEERNASGEKLADLSLVYELEYRSLMPVEKAINFLLSEDAIEFAEPVYIQRLTYVPNDTGIANEYQLTNIHAFQGWDISKGDTNVVIGITDTGNDTDHIDLEPMVKYNYSDPINGIDDDNDGYTDNYLGWDLGDNDNNPTCANSAVHGSFTSGCASAKPDNFAGIAGSGFNCKFLPVKISSGQLLTKAYEGIVYAADHGCRIINASWGSYGGGQFGQLVIDYATNNRNSLVIAGAGNNNNADPFYPASYQNVLSVAATDSDDVRWTQSSYGSYIDLTAPGVRVLSTIYPHTWSYSSGTSFSSPIVAGCAGIIKSYYPSLNAVQIGERLRVTSDDVDTIAGNAGFQHQLGKGRVNLYRALTESAKSVRMNNISISDHNDEAYVPADTLFIKGLFKNYLDPVSNVSVTLSSNSPDITILNGTFNIPSLATLVVIAKNFSALLNPS